MKLNYIDIPKPKKPKLLPKKISKKEVIEMINLTKNKKHKLIISFIYSSGMRLSEIINLKREDIDTIRNTILIKAGKGKKNRITILSKKVKSQLIDYLIKTEFNSKYLFEGRNNKKYSKKSIQLIVNNAGKKLNKKVSPHTLRHSFGTHLLESETEIRFIQKLLGHSKLETTSIYTHVAINKLKNIKSPFDNF